MTLRRLLACFVAAAALVIAPGTGVTAPIATADEREVDGDALYDGAYIDHGTVSTVFKPLSTQYIFSPLTPATITTDGVAINPLTGEWTWSIDGANTPPLRPQGTEAPLLGRVTITDGINTVILDHCTLLISRGELRLNCDIHQNNGSAQWETWAHTNLTAGLLPRLGLDNATMPTIANMGWGYNPLEWFDGDINELGTEPLQLSFATRPKDAPAHPVTLPSITGDSGWAALSSALNPVLIANPLAVFALSSPSPLSS